MKNAFLNLSVLMLVIFMGFTSFSCDNKSDTTSYGDKNNQTKTFTYNDPYNSGAYMLPAEGGVYYYIANSDLIVKGSVVSITDVKDYVFPGSSGKPGCAKIANINIKNVYYSIDKIKVKPADSVNLVVNVLGCENPEYVVYEQEEYILFMRESLKAGDYLTLRMGKGRISESTQKAGKKHEVFGNKGIGEIELSIQDAVKKINNQSVVVVKKYEFPKDEIKNSGVVIGEIIIKDNIPDSVKAKIDSDADAIILFQSNGNGHIDFNRFIEIDNYLYLRLDWKNDYSSDYDYLFVAKGVKSGSVILNSITQRF